MKFSALIVERSRKILFLSFVAAVVGITVYGIIWNLHTRESSKEFILSHLKEVIVAEVHSQNTFNIDGELNRIVDSWSKTQEFPLRVDVYIDGKHWAHGGPMRPFEFPSASDSHSEKLATGQVLSFDVNMDLTGPIVRLLAALLIFIGFFVAVYFSLKKGLTKAVEELTGVTAPEAARKLNDYAIVAIKTVQGAIVFIRTSGLGSSLPFVDQLDKVDDVLTQIISTLQAACPESDIATPVASPAAA